MKSHSEFLIHKSHLLYAFVSFMRAFFIFFQASGSGVEDLETHANFITPRYFPEKEAAQRPQIADGVTEVTL